MKIRLVGLLMVFMTSAMAHPPYGIEMDKMGNLYFADIIHNSRGTLWKLDKDLKLAAILKDFHAHNVNIDNEGNIYSAHGEDTHTLIRINTSGKIDTIIMTEDMDDFFGGNCAVSPDAKVYYGIDRKIWEWNADGRISKINGELKWNQGFYVDEEGKIYATDIGLGRGGCLVEIDKNGSSRIIAENLISVGDRDFDPTHEVLLGVRKDGKGNLYVCDLGGNRIAMINPEGVVSTHYRSEKDWKPCGIFIGEKAEFILEIGKDWKGPRIIKKLGSNSEVYFDYDTHQNSPVVIPTPGKINIPWQFIAVFFPVIVFAFYQFRIKKSQEVVNVA